MLRGVTPPIPACASHPRRLTWIVLMFHIGVFRCWLRTPTILTAIMMGSGVRVRVPN